MKALIPLEFVEAVSKAQLWLCFNRMHTSMLGKDVLWVLTFGLRNLSLTSIRGRQQLIRGLSMFSGCLPVEPPVESNL